MSESTADRVRAVIAKWTPEMERCKASADQNTSGFGSDLEDVFSDLEAVLSAAPTEQTVLSCAYAFAAARLAEHAARTAFKQTQRAPGTPAPKVHTLHDALLAAEDATTEARSALIRAACDLPELELPESKFDVTGAP